MYVSFFEFFRKLKSFKKSNYSNFKDFGEINQNIGYFHLDFIWGGDNFGFGFWVFIPREYLFSGSPGLPPFTSISFRDLALFPYVCMYM
jgi:hypothetical protein